jgi:hypothetical protein
MVYDSGGKRKTFGWPARVSGRAFADCRKERSLIRQEGFSEKQLLGVSTGGCVTLGAAETCLKEKAWKKKLDTPVSGTLYTLTTFKVPLRLNRETGVKSGAVPPL